MNPSVIVNILSMILAAEPPIVQAVHDLLAGSGGQTDQAVLTADAVDWQEVIAKAKAVVNTAPTPPIKP